MDKENNVESHSSGRRHVGAILLFLLGLLLPFISNTCGDLSWGCYPRYLEIINRSGGFTFLLIVEMFNLVPIILCVLSFYCFVLDSLRFLPIIATYLFILVGHLEPPSGDGLWGLVIVAAPLFSIPVFIVSFIITLLIAGLSGKFTPPQDY
ncbi:MAG: hypothetical protein LBE12_14020 [Planctomycetaceae bacterium]|jgi:hypothetical protein|nr:hypothetical protein [Planctomycetaceae bacterium]